MSEAKAKTAQAGRGNCRGVVNGGIAACLWVKDVGSVHVVYV